MLSKEEIDALLKNPKPIVRMATEQDHKWLIDYINTYPERFNEETRAFIAQLALHEMVVTDETDAFIAFSGQSKQRDQYQLNDSWFIHIPKMGGF